MVIHFPNIRTIYHMKFIILLLKETFFDFPYFKYGKTMSSQIGAFHLYNFLGYTMISSELNSDLRGKTSIFCEICDVFSHLNDGKLNLSLVFLAPHLLLFDLIFLFNSFTESCLIFFRISYYQILLLKMKIMLQ